MKKWSITARISFGFALVLGSLCLLTGLSMSRMNAIYNIEHTHLQKELPAARLATEFQRDLLLARIGFIYHVTIQKPGARDQGWQKFKLAQEHLNDLRELVNASGELQESKPFVDKMQRDLAVYAVALGKTMALVDSGVLSGPVYTAQVKDWAAKGAIAVDDADKAEQLYNGKSTASTDATLASLRKTMMRDGMIALAAILGCVALMVSIGRRINRDLRSINAELSNGAGLVGDTSTRLSSAAQHLAEGASQQTASLDQTATAARQVNDSSAKNAEVSKSASEILSIAHRHIEDGNDKLSAMVFSMENIQTSSRQIAKIIQVIDEIAFQTNILALNAAVESAHAGEAGMGFAVVADEVRSLARRTAQAAQETAGLIEQSVRTTSEGSAKLAQLQDSMERITGASQKVRALMTEVSASSREQTHGMDRITGSIRDIEQITRTAAASAQETAAVSQEMDTQSADMRALVARLTALVEGHRGELSPAA